MHWACQHGHKELAQALLYCRASGRCLNIKDLAPVHLAVAEGHTDILEILLEHDQDLVRCVSPFTGLYPLHVAAVHRQIACAALLLQYGARVTQLTDEMPVDPSNRFTVFHLAAYKVAGRRLKQYNARVRVESTTILLESPTATDEEEEERRTFEMLDMCMEQLPPEPVRIVIDSRFGSVLHYFAAINYVAGIEMITAAPYNHPPDVLNMSGYSPLLIGLNNRQGSMVLHRKSYFSLFPIFEIINFSPSVDTI